MADLSDISATYRIASPSIWISIQGFGFDLRVDEAKVLYLELRKLMAEYVGTPDVMEG